MLTHLRMKALERFKTGLNSSLESGKGFAVSARENTECSLKDFEQGCAGNHILVISSQALVKFNPY